MLCSRPFKVPYICNGWGEGGGVLLAETYNILVTQNNPTLKFIQPPATSTNMTIFINKLAATHVNRSQHLKPQVLAKKHLNLNFLPHRNITESPLLKQSDSLCLQTILLLIPRII
jgi:hypothetical protein